MKYDRDIIVSCSYMQAKMLAEELKKQNIETALIDNTAAAGYDFYLSAEENKIIGHVRSETILKEDGYQIIGFNELDIDYEGLDHFSESSESFKLNEVVHAVIHNNEPFNPFANDEHITAWISFKDIFHIEHTYDEDIFIDEMCGDEDV